MSDLYPKMEQQKGEFHGGDSMPPPYTEAQPSSDQQTPPTQYQQQYQPAQQSMGYSPYAMGPPQAIAVPVGIVYTTSLHYGDHPQQLICPHCRANVLSQVKHETGLITWLIAGGLCLLGCWAGCCLVPFCVDACKDVEHYCPNCRALMGRNKKL